MKASAVRVKRVIHGDVSNADNSDRQEDKHARQPSITIGARGDASATAGIAFVQLSFLGFCFSRQKNTRMEKAEEDKTLRREPLRLPGLTPIRQSPAPEQAAKPDPPAASGTEDRRKKRKEDNAARRKEDNTENKKREQASEAKREETVESIRSSYHPKRPV